MSVRPHEIERPNSVEGARYAWHLRFKGVHGRGTYGSVITDQQGHGLYLLADGDLLGAPGYEGRMTCLVSPKEFWVDPQAQPLEAREAIAAALLPLGWGPIIRDDAAARSRDA